LTEVIDLHGLSHKDAILATELSLTKIFINTNFKLKVITGNSLTLQKKIIKEVVDKYYLNYYIPSNNLGILIITDIQL